jgi:hypothetical protein
MDASKQLVRDEPKWHGVLAMRLFVLFAVFLAFNAAARLAHADDPCAAFTWDVAHERSLFSQQPQPLAAGATLAASPAIVTDRLYQLELRMQAEVTLPATPGKQPKSDGVYAGLLRLTVHARRVYRISLDQPVWVDVIENGTVIAASDFQGRKGCSAPHKVVEFLLQAGSPITLQFSGSSAAVVKVAVTRSPSGTS